MLKYILFALLSFNLYALEVSLHSAKEESKKFSTLHIKNKEPFLCEEIKDDFDTTTKIICAFSKQPSSQFKNLQNNFFRIRSQVKNKTFFLIINPYKKIKLFPIIFDISKDNSVFQADLKMSKHWMILGYDDKPPFIKKEKKLETSINFPYFQSTDKLPYIGSLDLKGNPVYIKKVQDVSDYLKIKEYYNNGKYDYCLDLIDQITFKYPNSLFMAELLFYKIRVYAKLNEYDNLLEVAKIFLMDYSSDENIPEVLSQTARSYAKLGINSDADYFFDRLFSEHKDSPYCQWGYIYKAKMLEESGTSSKAFVYYNKALDETKSIDIAATAAFSLIHYYMNNVKTQEAAVYTMKIIKAKPSFFNDNYDKSYSVFSYFKEEEDYKTAAELARVILNEIDVKHDDYEVLLKDRAILLSLTDKKEEALEALNKYLKKYEDGEYLREIKIAKDSLFFDGIDSNLSAKIKNYNNLIDTYNGDTIGDKAIYKKAKLLLENEMYKDVLGFEDSILALDTDIFTDTSNIIHNAAIGFMKQSLNLKDCQEVLNISHEYNVTLANKFDDGIYDCSMKGSDFELAKSIASKNLKVKELDKRKKWLYKYLNVDFKTGDYIDVIEASKELIILIRDEIDSEYKDVYRILFDSYQRLEDKINMIETIVVLEKVYGLDYKDIERYISIMGIGSQTNDNTLILKYGNNVMNIQKKSNSYTQSPYVEFTLYQAYIDLQNYNEALEVIKSLDNVNLSKSKRARQKYILGTLYEKLWREEEAQIAYKESIEADETSPWAKLAKGAIDI